MNKKFKKIKYSYLLEQFKFGWHYELQNNSSDLHLLVHLFVKRLFLHHYFLKSRPPKKIAH
jgi:hypothetical protein